MGSAQTAERPKLGRPPKKPPSEPRPVAAKANGQLTKNADPSAPFPEPSLPVDPKTKPREKPLAKSTHTMKLRNQK